MLKSIYVHIPPLLLLISWPMAVQQVNCQQSGPLSQTDFPNQGDPLGTSKAVLKTSSPMAATGTSSLLTCAQSTSAAFALSPTNHDIIQFRPDLQAPIATIPQTQALSTLFSLSFLEDIANRAYLAFSHAWSSLQNYLTSILDTESSATTLATGLSVVTSTITTIGFNTQGFIAETCRSLSGYYTLGLESGMQAAEKWKLIAHSWMPQAIMLDLWHSILGAIRRLALVTGVIAIVCAWLLGQYWLLLIGIELVAVAVVGMLETMGWFYWLWSWF